MEDSDIMREESEAGPSRSIEESLVHNLRQQKHNIFLSHSGAQKEFVRRLRNELKRNAYNPFFDEDPDSLPPGEPFVKHLKDAARQADVAVLVLSDDFLTSKWPMIELEIFVKELKRRRSVFGCRKLSILPLFMGLSVEEFRNGEQRLGLSKKWQELAVADRRIDVLEWEGAVGVVGGINGAKYSDFRTEEDYIHNIVSVIFKLVPPDLMWEDTHVRGKLKLCEAVAAMFKKAPASTRVLNVRAIGLYGMGGLGKTTICKLLCNDYFVEFNGKVWHAELGKKGASETQKDVLRNLVGISEALLNETVKSEDQWRSLLRRTIEHKVFLAIDNVWNLSQEQAEALLQIGFHPSSLVVVTSRSREVLEWLGIQKECCFEMPELDKDDAKALLLQAAAPGHEKGSRTDTQLVAVDRVVERCFLSKGPISSTGCGKQYVPLALKVLGRQLRLPLVGDQMKLTEWVERLDLKRSDQKQHPIFSVLRLSYDNLRSDRHRSIFMDVALYAPRREDNTLASVKENCKWLSMVYRVDIDVVLELMVDLKRDGLLERWEDLASPCGMHELYLEFSKAEATTGENFAEQVYLYHEGGLGAQEIMHAYGRLRRVHFFNCRFSELCTEELQFMVHVEVLKVDSCSTLVSIELQCMKSLLSLELRGCFGLQRVEGLKDLKHLKFFRCVLCHVDGEKIEFPSSMEIVEIYGSKPSQGGSIGSTEECWHPERSSLSFFHKLMKVVLSNRRAVMHFPNLQVVHISNCYKLEDFGDLSLLMALQEVRLRECGSLRRLYHLHSSHLKVLHISSCNKLKDMGDLSLLMALQEIRLEDCWSLLRLRNLCSPHLRVLDISRCYKLKDLGNLSLLTALQEVRLWGCWALLRLQNLESPQLKLLHISHCPKLEDLGDLSPLMALQEVCLEYCGSISCLQYLQSPHLITLDIFWCAMLADLGDLTLLMALQTIRLKGCSPLLRLQNIRSPHLRVLEILSCKNLTNLGDLTPLMALQEIHLEDCSSLLYLKNLGSPQLKVLHISQCDKLEDLGDLRPLMALQEVHLLKCRSLSHLQNLYSPDLRVLHISHCSKLVNLGDLNPSVALQEVCLESSRLLLHLPNFHNPYLRVLKLVTCDMLMDLGDFSLSKALEEVHIYECQSLSCLQNLQNPHLKILKISSCPKLVDLGDLSPLKALQEVYLERCKSLLLLQNIQSPHLRVLCISHCSTLKDLGDLSPLEALQEVRLERCESLLHMRNLRSPLLKNLHISYCSKLGGLGDLSPLVALQEIYIYQCESILWLQNLHCLDLRVLHISYCSKLKGVGDLSQLMALRELHLYDCGSLLHLQNLQSPHLRKFKIWRCNKLDLSNLSQSVLWRLDMNRN